VSGLDGPADRADDGRRNVAAAEGDDRQSARPAAGAVLDPRLVHAGERLDQIDARLEARDAESGLGGLVAPRDPRQRLPAEDDAARVDVPERTEFRRRE
jgi:hypothetical protein